MLGRTLISLISMTFCFFLASFFFFCCSYLNLPKSSILHTGGSAFGLISTRSRPTENARCMASRAVMTPCISPSSSIRRTCGMRISSFTLGPSRVGGAAIGPRAIVLSYLCCVSSSATRRALCSKSWHASHQFGQHRVFCSKSGLIIKPSRVTAVLWFTYRSRGRGQPAPWDSRTNKSCPAPAPSHPRMSPTGPASTYFPTQSDRLITGAGRSRFPAETRRATSIGHLKIGRGCLGCKRGDRLLQSDHLLRMAPQPAQRHGAGLRFLPPDHRQHGDMGQAVPADLGVDLLIGQVG